MTALLAYDPQVNGGWVSRLPSLLASFEPEHGRSNSRFFWEERDQTTFSTESGPGVSVADDKGPCK
jgi:hypothetical protein